MDSDQNFGLHGKLAEYIDFAASKMKSTLQLGNNGTCAFKHDRGRMEFAVELREGSDIVYFYSPICKVPCHFPEQFFEKLLENNLHGIANSQAGSGLDSKVQNIVLTYSISINHLDTLPFENILLNFVQTAEKAAINTGKWIEEIASKYTLSDEESEEENSEAVKNMKIRVQHGRSNRVN
ncbi:MAG: CesT family type III secretion system chaperone [Puniceicoccales bacterium]|jgi:hypothetical protein|nr:CesT family type III secretion system chaperone [Puniceicoccales bacterium]